jgi:Ca-activated chloride channel homolog
MRKICLPVILLFISLSCDQQQGDINFTSAYLSDGRLDPALQSDRYNDLEENPFVDVSEHPVSTFSIDADGASYANVRRYINDRQPIPKGAIRTEEFLNYFPMNYEDSEDGHPISLNGEISSCPWKEDHRLIRIGIKGNLIPQHDLPASNLVLLIDVSGSMNDTDKLALLKKAFTMMIDNMKPDDRVAIVTYAGDAGVRLESTLASQKQVITGAISRLSSGGSTAGAKGIITAYEIAKQHFIKGGNNRVILGTDGDFNVGPSSQEELVSLIEEKRDEGIFLTVVGVGRGNLNDAMMEQVADHGNGTYEYIDSEAQAKKVFVDEYHKFYPAAKDVKVQIQFNPVLVESYRLIGYENRLLQEEDFENDAKDAGEISVGQTITALYEIKPKNTQMFRVDPSFTIDFRYKHPDENESAALTLHIFDEGKSFTEATENMRFAAGIAAFSMLLRNSAYKGSVTYDDIINGAVNARSFDPYDHRAEFIELVKKARTR